VQESVFREIEDVLERFDGRLDNETISELNLLEAAINEDLRLMGPVTMHERVCTKDCEVSWEEGVE
jgi:cytochrome P450